jgi:hypothetical protein
MVARRATVHYSRSTIPWRVLRYGVRLAEAAGHIFIIKIYRFQMLCSSQIDFHRGFFAINLIDLLEAYRSVFATDFKDIVYAFLKISRNINRKKINLEPNYSLTIAEVYTRITV